MGGRNSKKVDPVYSNPIQGEQIEKLNDIKILTQQIEVFYNDNIKPLSDKIDQHIDYLNGNNIEGLKKQEALIKIDTIMKDYTKQQATVDKMIEGVKNRKDVYAPKPQETSGQEGRKTKGGGSKRTKKKKKKSGKKKTKSKKKKHSNLKGG